MFSETSVILFPGGIMSLPVWSYVPSFRGGCLFPGGGRSGAWGEYVSPGTDIVEAIAPVGTHPTGMHFC